MSAAKMSKETRGKEDIGKEKMRSATSMDSTNRIVTVPNAITLMRVACLPIFCWMLFGLNDRAGAAILLGALGASDWVDGWVARRFNQTSALGEIMDPVADRLLFFVGIIAIAVDGSAPLVLCVLVLAREAAVSVATLVLAAMGAQRVSVTWIGKTGAFVLMFAFPLFLMSNADVSGTQWWELAAWICGISGTVIAYVSALGYIPLARQALRSRNVAGIKSDLESSES